MNKLKTSKLDNTDKDISISKVEKTIDSIIDILDKNKLNVKELLLTLGNIQYAVGASVGGYKDKGPSIEELDIKYATKPTLDVAIMLSGLVMTTWLVDLDKQLIDNIAKNKKT